MNVERAEDAYVKAMQPWLDVEIAFGPNPEDTALGRYITVEQLKLRDKWLAKMTKEQR